MRSLGVPVRWNEGFLILCVLQHKAKKGGEFPNSYQVNRLVYYEVYPHSITAIRSETEIKKWRREKKIVLIEKKNPTWEGLAADWMPMIDPPVR